MSSPPRILKKLWVLIAVLSAGAWCFAWEGVWWGRGEEKEGPHHPVNQSQAAESLDEEAQSLHTRKLLTRVLKHQPTQHHLTFRSPSRLRVLAPGCHRVQFHWGAAASSFASWVGESLHLCEQRAAFCRDWMGRPTSVGCGGDKLKPGAPRRPANQHQHRPHDCVKVIFFSFAYPMFQKILIRSNSRTDNRWSARWELRKPISQVAVHLERPTHLVDLSPGKLQEEWKALEDSQGFGGVMRGVFCVACTVPLLSVLFSRRRFICSGHWKSHLSPCLPSQVEEMGNPFKKLVLKPSDSPRPAPLVCPPPFPGASSFPLPVPLKALKSTAKPQTAAEIKYRSNFHIYL